MLTTRRDFHARMLSSLAVYGLIELAYTQDGVAAEVKPTVEQWLKQLNHLSMDLKGQKLKDTEFQTKLEELYAQVELEALLKRLDFDRIAAGTKLPDNGAANVGIDLTKVEGLPTRLGFGKQIFCVKKGRSIVPHGHNNMCTGFLILRGEFAGKHWDRVADEKEHYLIKPTIDRTFKPGETSTVSDHRDNIHWFKALSESAYVFNIHVIGYDMTNSQSSGRLYLDPDGEKVEGGLIRAAKMTSSACHKKYG